MKKNICLIIFCMMLLTLFASCNRNSDGKPKVTTEDLSKIPESPVEDFEWGECYRQESITGKIFTYKRITKYKGNDEVVKIPKEIDGIEVLGIDSASFTGTSVKKVIFPNTIHIIWEEAFMDCSSLKEVVFGNNLTIIDERAFFGCTSLEKANLPASIYTIGKEAFGRCDSLKKVFLPKGIENLGEKAFADSGVTEIIIEDGTENFGGFYAFGPNIKKLTIPASVKKLKEHIFYDGLTEVRFLGDAPTEIGEEPFGSKAVIYYDPNTKGWDDTVLKEYYTLKAIK